MFPPLSLPTSPPRQSTRPAELLCTGAAAHLISGWLPCSFAALCQWPSSAALGPLDHSGANIDTFLMGCIGIATLLAATTYAWRLCAQLRRSGKSPRHTSSDCIGASAAYPSRWRTRRTPGRCHLGRVRFAHHDHPASALPRAAGNPTCRHGPDAGSAAGAFGSDIQHPDQWT